MESEYIYTHKTVERVCKEESSFILGYKVDAGIMRHLRHLCFPLKTKKSDASEFLCEIMNA